MSESTDLIAEKYRLREELAEAKEQWEYFAELSKERFQENERLKAALRSIAGVEMLDKVSNDGDYVAAFYGIRHTAKQALDGK